MSKLWGIDLGGTKIEGVVLESVRNPNPLVRKRIPTEADQGYQHIVDQITSLVKLLAEEVGEQPQNIGIGTPGALDPISQTMKNSNTTCLNGKPLKEDLENSLKLPLKMANDANCFALAETKMGIVAEKSPDARVVFGIILGTGVGGGIVVNGQVLNGRQGIAGEWGHNYLDESGGPCYCGKVGCVETVISGPALQRHYHKLTGNTLSLKEIVEKHTRKNDQNASLVVKRLAHFFGKAVSTVVNILDPDVIVIGGGVGNIEALYTEGRLAAEKFTFNNQLHTEFLKPKLGDSAGVFGAAML